MEVLLDSSFIVSCVMKKIDFLDEFERLGLRAVLQREVLQELKDLKLKSKTSHEERVAINLAFEIFEKQKIRKMAIGGRNVDGGLIAKGSDGIYIATLDNGIKKNVPNKIVIDAARNGLKVERD